MLLFDLWQAVLTGYVPVHAHTLIHSKPAKFLAEEKLRHSDQARWEALVHKVARIF